MAKVALIKCEDYDTDRVYAAVCRGLRLLGGAEAFFKPGERIVLKPNLLSAVAPELCVTTHPSVFSAAARALLACGVRLSYGDSPAMGTCAAAARAAGLENIAQKLGIVQSDFDHGRMVKYTAAKTNATFPIANGVLEADGVVSLPKLKTHNFTRLTCAVKNQYGCVPGINKAKFHARFLLPQDFSEFVVDVSGFVRPRLYICDAIMAMEGNGPNTGNPKRLRLIMLSTDPVALDTVACSIVDIDPQFVPTCAAGERAGLGTCRMNTIECVGDPLAGFVNNTFAIVRRAPMGITGSGMRRRIKDMLAPRPVINHSRCIKCGKCVEICPVDPKAVYWTAEGKKRPPRHEYSRCIRCFCCQEACPELAISVRTPLPGLLLPYLAGAALPLASMQNRVVRWMKAGKKT